VSFASLRTGVLVAVLASTALAQPATLPHSVRPYHLDSGYLNNSSAQSVVVFTGTVTVANEDWIQLHFKDTNLPAGTRLRLTSLDDQAVQWFDGGSLRDYDNKSAFFNGGAVRVDLIAGPNTSGNRFLVESVMVGSAYPAVQESICGSTDDRTPSEDPRQGRTHPTGCTGWMINATTMLTAGHCTSGSRTENIHFNVPLSSSSGGLRMPPPQHQYTADRSTMQRLSGGIGSDWAVMSIVRNSNTGLYPGQAQGSWYRLGNVPGSVSGQTIRITGYGTTGGGVPRTWNQIQKTHTGPFVSNSGTTLRYAVDTTGGNSGSPVIHENTGDAIGIHTHAGCNSGGGSNQGTSIARSDLQTAIRQVRNIYAAGLTFNLGTGCPGSAGTPSLAAEGFPDLGSSVDFKTAQLPAGQTGALFLGGSNETWNGMTLPMDLTGSGMAGCTLYISPDITIPTVANASGETSFTVAVPNNSSLIRRAFFAQHAVVDPGSNQVGIVWSNGMFALIGD